MASDDHNETFDELTAETSFTDPAGVEHVGELADVTDLIGVGEGSPLALENEDGTPLLVAPVALQAGDNVSFVDDGDNTATLHATDTDTNTNTHISLENEDGVDLLSSPAALRAGDGLTFVDDGDNTATLNASATGTGGGPTDITDDVVVTGGTDHGDGTVTLTAGIAWLDTGLPEFANVTCAIGSNSQAQLDSQTLYDPNTETTKVRIQEVDSNVGTPRASYQILHWGTTEGNDLGGGDGGSLTSALHEDFETADYQFWTDVFDVSQISRSTTQPHAGSYSMRSTMQSGGHYAGTAWYEPVVAGDAASPYQEIYIQYYVRHEPGFEFANQRSKLPGPVSIHREPTAATPSNGYNGWGSRASYGEGPSNGTMKLGTYTYHMDQPGDFGEYFGFNQTLSVGDWHKIDQYCKVNTVSGGSANADGVLEMWVNDTQEVNEHSMRWTRQNDGIDFWIAFFFGGSNPAPQTQSIYTDEYRVDNTDFAGVHA